MVATTLALPFTAGVLLPGPATMTLQMSYRAVQQLLGESMARFTTMAWSTEHN